MSSLVAQPYHNLRGIIQLRPDGAQFLLPESFESSMPSHWKRGLPRRSIPLFPLAGNPISLTTAWELSLV
jgi:hypothetical protein